MILSKKNGTHSEFDLWCVMYDVEVGDTLIFKKKNQETELAVYVGENENEYPLFLTENGRTLVINPESMRVLGETSMKILQKSERSLLLKNIKREDAE